MADVAVENCKGYWERGCEQGWPRLLKFTMQTLEKEDISRIVSVQMDGSYDVATTFIFGMGIALCWGEQ